MPRVTILQREYAWRYTEDRRVEELVEVVYSTPALPPRGVRLPVTDYRPATPEEKAANPRYSYIPANGEAEERERRAIEVDSSQAMRSPATGFDL